MKAAMGAALLALCTLIVCVLAAAVLARFAGVFEPRGSLPTLPESDIMPP